MFGIVLLAGSVQEIGVAVDPLKLIDLQHELDLAAQSTSLISFAIISPLKFSNPGIFRVQVVDKQLANGKIFESNSITVTEKEEELKRAHSQIIDPIIEDLRSKGVDAVGVVRHGHSAETLCALANELDVSNIIIGRKGQSIIKAKLFGSVAITLVQISDQPVTVVP